MNTTRLLSLLKTKQPGRWCKLGAWAVLGFGLLQMIFISINAWQVYREEQFVANGMIQPFNPNYVTLLTYLANICSAAVFAITGFTLLFVAGTIFTALAASAEPEQDETNDIVYESLDRPVKLRKGSD